jgi:ribosomal protein S6
MKYELCYLVGESKEEDLAKIKEEVLAVISKEGGKWFDPQIEENRKMAYRIGKEIRGTYVSQQFEIAKDGEKEDEEKSSSINVIAKKLNLLGDILRFIIIRAEDVPPLRAREGKVAFTKDSGDGRGSYKKPVYFKKSGPVVEEKAKIKKEDTVLTPETKKDKTEEEKETKKKIQDEKSIDEKIDEILNI